VLNEWTTCYKGCCVGLDRRWCTLALTFVAMRFRLLTERLQKGMICNVIC